jgi:hypothetical protein
MHFFMFKLNKKDIIDNKWWNCILKKIKEQKKHKKTNNSLDFMDYR